MKKQPVRKPTLISVLKTYWIHSIFIFFLANFVVTRALQLSFMAESCMTKEMITNDQRCLYVYANNVYKKGTRAEPHMGQPCGKDVTSILPASHMAKMIKYLDPNLVGQYCANSTPTNTPTALPPTPIGVSPTSLPLPTATIRTNPTGTQPSVQPSTLPTQTPRILSTPLPSVIPPSPNATETPVTQQSSGTGFGKYLGNPPSSELSPEDQNSSEIATNELLPTKTYTAGFWTSIIFWSELLTAGSFIILVLSLIVGGVRYISRRSHPK